MLEQGEYALNLQTDAHTVKVQPDGAALEALTYSVSADVIYDATNPRQSEIIAQTGEFVNLLDQSKTDHTVRPATNVFDDVNAHFIEYTDPADPLKLVNMTRSNFEASYPTAPTAEELSSASMTADELLEMELYKTDYINPEDIAPVTEAGHTYDLIDLRGAAYNDTKWEDLLNTLSAKDMYSLVRNGNAKTIRLASIQKPLTTEMDGPAGLGLYGGLTEDSCNSYCSEIVTASTWNVELAEKIGIAVGEEAFWSGISGWYAPAGNVHRMAYGGRNFEYFSEDPLLAGKMASAEIIGAGQLGVYTYMKHFGLNELDTNRIKGLCCWANEQTIREVYMRAFEIAIKEPVVTLSYWDEETGGIAQKEIRASTALMGSFDRIGVYPSSCCEQLLNQITRAEWGFLGTVMTDSNNDFGGESVLDPERLLATGGDLNLSAESTNSCVYDYKNASAQILLRRATHNILYMVTNSNAMNGVSSGAQVTYSLAWWEVLLAALNVLVYTVIIFLVVVLIRHNCKWKKAQNQKREQPTQE